MPLNITPTLLSDTLHEAKVEANVVLWGPGQWHWQEGDGVRQRYNQLYRGETMTRAWPPPLVTEPPRWSLKTG